ncbi:biotin--[acetyl-CoA-carboxylase] ligase [Poriferisphaera sp. WC338]|uniref:biotin--[acetyl-CoA-carboxylase] ligase n=1 Tax=Poriferisphaera sp. WC338 TaxID=3425129 RepID=UPI003D81BF5B
MLVYHHEEVDSTSTRAAELAKEMPGEIILVSADRQTAGRGRMGRAWQSPAGGAWLSLVWPSAHNAVKMQSSPLVVGLAVGNAIAELVQGEQVGMLDASVVLKIKWPNDLLLDGRKIAGILCEQVLNASIGRADSHGCTMILGVGINANVDTHTLGSDLRQPPISLAEAIGHPIDLPKLISLCGKHIVSSMQRLEQNGFAGEMRAKIQSQLAWLNESVELDVGSKVQTGTFMGIDDQGRLLIEANGVMTPHTSGEISKLRLA